MEYKYQATIALYQLADCSPKDDGTLPCECYHYIFEEENHADNFLPISERKPERVNSAKDQQKCSLIGLSCYLSAEEATKKWNRYNKYPDYAFEKSVGTILCKLCLNKEDGTATKDKEHSTHFNFYEYSSTNLKSKILEKKPITKQNQ